MANDIEKEIAIDTAKGHTKYCSTPGQIGETYRTILKAMKEEK